MDKLTEITTRQKDGKMAPDFDTFIWGWGGDPYDPSLLLNLLTTKAIGGSSDSFYSNPEYDRLYDEQAGEFDLAKRQQTVKQLVAISQRDLPYLVLTIDPILQGYRTDSLSGAAQACPKPDGDLICDQVSYQPWLTLGPPGAGGGRAASSSAGGGTSALVYVVIAVAVLLAATIAFVIVRRRRQSQEAIEV